MYMYVYMYMYMYICIYVYMCMCMCIYIYIYIYTTKSATDQRMSSISFRTSGYPDYYGLAVKLDHILQTISSHLNNNNNNNINIMIMTIITS